MIDRRTFQMSLAFATIAAALGVVANTALAQDDARVQRARAKGPVNLYGPIAPEELRNELLAGFKRKTGLSVNVYFGGTGQVFSRLTTERKSGSYVADVVCLADLDLVNQLVRDGAVRAHTHSALPVDQRDPKGFRHVFAQTAVVLQYSTKGVRGGEVPTSWKELADPKWKGKVAIADPARSSTGLIFLKLMVNDHGWPWMEALLRNDPLVMPISPQIVQTLASGERLVGTSPSETASEMMKANAPVSLAKVEVLNLSPITASVVDRAANPEGAELLVEYMLSAEAAALYTKYGLFSALPDAPGPYGFPSVKDLKVLHRELPSNNMTRQDYLDKYNEIVKAVRK